MLVSSTAAERPLFVPETRFGRWFLGTETWFQSVLKVALLDLFRLIDDRKKSYPVVVDVGCGMGRSFRLMKILFRPTRLIGIDYEDENLEAARKRTESERIEVDFLRNDCAAIDLPDASADLLLCHQTFHHLVQQEKALREFRRVLKPGGLLLFAESTRAYIHSWIIRLLFAHPMDVQRTADEYLAMVRAAGFEFEERNVSLPYLWWSRPDLGILERLGFSPKRRGDRVETLVNVVARKPE
ncbi:MAG: class I SAM-dependent methyltransferase [Polyangiaceae bacterium]|jgi:SAM-dependent methyltransferase